MKKQLILTVLLLSAISIGARLLPHVANIAPIGALALFAGVYLPKRWAFIVPVAVMLISDIFVGFYELPVMFLVYASFLIMVAIGSSPFVKGRGPRSGEGFALRIGLGALSGSLIFFIATNFGTWAFSNLYPHTWSGLMWAYTMGLPFFKSTLVGDLAWSVAFFGGYAIVHHLVKKSWPVPAIDSAASHTATFH